MQHNAHVALYRIATRIISHPASTDTRSNDELLNEIASIIDAQKG